MRIFHQWWRSSECGRDLLHLGGAPQLPFPRSWELEPEGPDTEMLFLWIHLVKVYLGLENQSHHSKEVFFLSQRKPLFQVSVFSAGRLSPEVHSTILMRIPGIQAVAVLDAADLLYDSGHSNWGSVTTQSGWMGREFARRFQRERTYVYLWLIHVDVWQKPTRYCKAIILQLK